MWPRYFSYHEELETWYRNYGSKLIPLRRTPISSKSWLYRRKNGAILKTNAVVLLGVIIIIIITIIIIIIIIITIIIIIIIITIIIIIIIYTYIIYIYIYINVYITKNVD